ncbi:chromosomal replication initiator protein DnaA [Candidatus Dependentiae bacterium]|nr:chromosomal replication initiator protein DnaA [Candidatus Dependentiae bacterium]MBU4386963.1 chromosomal replication initiator protein DnaA [Candidatus Dependentiae bacterium]MCG2756720.1 chromosomal replication initiator protein DnaA [Candidatus Dependentiae bacterium]
MENIWQNFLKNIKEEVGSQTVETWFKAVSLEKLSHETNTVYLNAPNQFVKNWLKEHYLNLITNNLQSLLKLNNLTVEFISPEVKQINKKNIIPASVIQTIETQATVNKNQDSNIENNSNNSIEKLEPKLNLPTKENNLLKKTNNLNPNYNFDTFIVGPNNSLAHAAGYAICQNLGKVYNPLFIYGGTGLGKTHLLHAIGNEVKNKDNSKIILYQTTDKFTNEFISAIRLDKIAIFRQKYQKIDLLLLDDIQFLSNKEQTQEMFFHIFNLLYEEKKQIILSSDTFPKEIKGLQARLKSRLEWGLVVDIQMPDLETKIAILQKKAEQNGIILTEDVVNFIASKVTSNIRELEGCLIRVSAFSTLTNKPISLDLAKRVLLHLNDNNKKEGIMLERVLHVTASYYSMSINDLRSQKRQKNIALIRQVTFYMMKKLTFCSLKTIGEFVGQRDHSTVLHAITKVEQMIEQDRDFAKKLNNIEQKILTS